MGARLPEPTEGPASCKVWEIKTLGRTDDARAREMLEKTAWQVQPIMRKRGWKVAELCEMKPEQRDRVGDNLNMGQRALAEKVTQVNEYMRTKRLPVEIRDKVRAPDTRVLLLGANV